MPNPNDIAMINELLRFDLKSTAESDSHTQGFGADWVALRPRINWIEISLNMHVLFKITAPRDSNSSSQKREYSAAGI